VKQKRYPVEPLLALSGLSLSALLGRRTNGTEYRRIRDEGLTELWADRCAVAAGFVPWQVWPEWLDDSIARCEVECADEGCPTRFLPSRAGHRFCSSACSNRRRQRLLYRADPEFRAARRAANAAYQQDSRRSVLAKQRARYWADPDAVRAARRERYRRDADVERAARRARYWAQKKAAA
jgi:hypothetical protein